MAGACTVLSAFDLKDTKRLYHPQITQIKIY